MIKVIITDYGGVLVQNPSKPELLAPLAEPLGVTWQQLRHAVFGEDGTLWNAAKVGAISEDEHKASMQQALGISEAGAETLWQKLWLEPVPHQGYIDRLYALKGNYPIAMLSNAAPIFDEVWERLGFNDWFTLFINSSAVKCAKPDPAIYHLVVAKLGVEANQCVFLDDQQKNLGPAAAVGLRVIHFVEPQQAINDLNAMLAENG